MHSTFYPLSSHLPESLGKAMFISQGVLQSDSADPIHVLGAPSIPLLDGENGLEDTERGKGKLGQSERVAWKYIHYQM